MICFDVRVIYICSTRFKNLRCNPVLKLLKVFPVNDFLVFLITKCFMLDGKGFLDSPLHAIDKTCKSFQLIILNIFKYKTSRFLQFWCKLYTRRIVKTCLFRFLRDYYGNSLNDMFPQFPNHFLPFPMVFPHVSLSVSTISSGVSTISPHCFPHFLFWILRFIFQWVSNWLKYKHPILSVKTMSVLIFCRPKFLSLRTYESFRLNEKFGSFWIFM